MVRRTFAAGAFLATGLLAQGAGADVVPGRIVAIEGATPAGQASDVSNVFQPFVNADGEVGFLATLDDGQEAVFVDDQVIWTSGEEVETFTSFSSDMGTSPAGEFVIRGTVDGSSSLWTHDDLLLTGGDPAPGFPLFPTAAFTFGNGPSMDGLGTVYFRGSVDITNDGGSDVGGLYFAADADPAQIEAIYLSGDVVDGVTLEGGTGAISDDFAASNDGTHLIAALRASGNALTDRLLVVDDMIVAREGDLVPSFMGEQWQVFDLVGINDDGNYVFSGDTSAPGGSDEFVGYNGDVVVHAGDLLDGIQLAFTLRFLAINNRNHALIGWAWSNGGSVVEVVFHACDASDIPGTARRLVQTADTIDIDGDMLGDFSVADIHGNTGDKSQGIGDVDAVYVELDLDPGDRNAIVEIPVTCCGNGDTNGGEDCDDANAVETDDCLSTCVAASCGDGFVWAGVEDCDDANDDDDDECPNNCLLGGGSSSSSSSSSSGDAESSSGSSSSSTGAAATDTGDSTGSTTTGTSTTGDPATSDASATATDGSTTTTGAPTSGPTSSATSPETSGTSAPPTSSTASSETETDGDSAPAADDDGCGCASSRPHGAALWLGVLLLGGSLRRRRRARLRE